MNRWRQHQTRQADDRLGHAHLAATIAQELSISADDIVAVAATATLTAIRNSLLGHVRGDSTPLETIAGRLTDATDRAATCSTRS